MGTMIEIRCKKCHQSWIHNIGVGRMTGRNSRQITPNDKDLPRYIPAPDRPKIAEIAKNKTIFLDLYAGNMICKCNKCNTFNSRPAARVKDKEGNTIYEVPPQKCPKCRKRMHYIDLDEDKHNTWNSNEAEILAKELTTCPECSGELECSRIGCWD